MPSADFCQPIGSLPATLAPWGRRGRSPRVRRVTFSPYTCHLYFHSLRITLGFEYFGPLARLRLPHQCFPFGQAGDLLTASFRFNLAVDTLAVRLTVPVIRARRGLTPPSHFAVRFRSPLAKRQSRRFAPCLAHQQKRATGKPVALAKAMLARP